DSGAYALSPDGKQFAFIGSVSKPVRSYSQPDLWVMDVAPNAKPRNLTADFDFDVGGGVGGDNTAPRGGCGNQLVWTADGRSIIATYGKEGRANVGTFDAVKGTLLDVTRGNHAVVSFRTTPDTTKFVFTISTPTQVGDLFWLERNPVDTAHVAD